MCVALCRLEKEKNQFKAEVDDLQGQLEHLNKGKVSSIAILSQNSMGNFDILFLIN